MAKKQFLYFVIFLSLLCFTVMGFALSKQSPTFKQVVFFGDSLTDNGNLYRMTAGLFPAYPPYFKGRFSNGNTWADLVAYRLYEKYFILSQNFAVGGATAVSHNPFHGYSPITLGMEYNSYAIKNLLKDKSDTLYFIWIGANDYLQGSKHVDQSTTAVVNAIVGLVDQLIVNPSAQFFIIDMPDLALSPEAGVKHLAKNYQALVDSHNEKLQTAIKALQVKYPNTPIYFFDFSKKALLKNMIESKKYRDKINAKYHVDITNVTQPCLLGALISTSLSVPQSQLALTGKMIQAGSSRMDAKRVAATIKHNASLLEAYNLSQNPQTIQVCEHANHHLFWDHMHPSAAVHRVLASMFLKKVLH